MPSSLTSASCLISCLKPVQFVIQSDSGHHQPILLELSLFKTIPIVSVCRIQLIQLPHISVLLDFRHILPKYQQDILSTDSVFTYSLSSTLPTSSQQLYSNWIVKWVTPKCPQYLFQSHRWQIVQWTKCHLQIYMGFEKSVLVQCPMWIDDDERYSHPSFSSSRYFIDIHRVCLASDVAADPIFHVWRMYSPISTVNAGSIQ